MTWILKSNQDKNSVVALSTFIVLEIMIKSISEKQQAAF